MAAFPLDRAQVLARGTPETTLRAREYLQQGAVGERRRKGDTLFADVEGSRGDEYQVTVRFGPSDILSAYCTCPYDWGGDCKHIVAVLMTYLEEPETFEMEPGPGELLAGLDSSALRELLEQAYEQVAGFSTWLSAAVQPFRGKMPVRGQDEGAARAEPPGIDPAPVEREIRRLLRCASTDSWGGSNAPELLEPVVDRAWRLLKQGDGRDALTILRLICDTVVAEYEELEGENEIFMFLEELARLMAMSILLADLEPSSRERLEEELAEWQSHLGYYGAEEALAIAQEALAVGWEIPDEEPEAAAALESACTLADVQLDALEYAGRLDAFLERATLLERHGRKALKLIELGRWEEGLRVAEQHLQAPRDIRAVAEALRAAGRIKEAVRLAEHGLARPDEGGELGRWLAPIAEQEGNRDLALRAWRKAYEARPDRTSFEGVRRLTPTLEWPAARLELLARIHETVRKDDAIEVYLTAGEIDRAIALADESPFGQALVQVVTAATSVRPDWVIEVCRGKAEEILNQARSRQYSQAVEWLARMKAAHQEAGTMEAWNTYLDELARKHSRKRTFLPLLRGLGFRAGPG